MTLDKERLRVLASDCTSHPLSQHITQIEEAGEGLYALLSENAALAAEVGRLRKTLEVTTAVAITMLFDSHREDVKRVFTVDELEQVVAATEPLQSMNVQTEEIYRSAWDAIRADKGGAPS